MLTHKIKNVDEYIASFPKETQKMLEQFRKTVKKAAPKADELISYNMPAFKYHGVLVYFAGYKNHIGFYPTSSGIRTFKKELSAYKGAKGSVQFPLTQALPLDIISKIVTFRVKENLEKEEFKKQKRKSKDPFFSSLVAPARRALENKGITDLKQLSTYSETDILTLHGMGPGSLPKLRSLLKTNGLTFKK